MKSDNITSTSLPYSLDNLSNVSIRLNTNQQQFQTDGNILSVMKYMATDVLQILADDITAPNL